MAAVRTEERRGEPGWAAAGDGDFERFHVEIRRVMEDAITL
jgi:hypothetical protein